MQTVYYVRKPLVVEAVQVTEDNIYDVAKWCDGDVRTNEEGQKVLDVKVLHPSNKSQTVAGPTDWVLRSEHGYKIFNHRAFMRGFEKATTFNELPEDIKESLRKIGHKS